LTVIPAPRRFATRIGRVAVSDHYFAVVEGTPSLSLGLGIKASMARDQRLMDPSDPSSDPGYWATIATVLQAVPQVCDADPGILGPVAPDLHWVPDFRELSDASPVSRAAVPL
jgi:hypothetical protein